MTAVSVGLICALPEELAHLRDALRHTRSVHVAQTRFDEGTLDGHRVVLVGAGMGKVNAALAASVLADRFRCRSIAFSGVAGGLDPALRIGDVVVAERAVQHDAGLIVDNRLQTYQPGHVPFINPTERLGYTVEPALLQRIRDHLLGMQLRPLPLAAGGDDTPPQIVFGTVLTGDQYLHCGSTRDRLHRGFAGHAIEMEGGAVAQVAAAYGIPWVVVRALSDLAGHDSGIDFQAFAGVVAANSAAILRRLLPVL